LRVARDHRTAFRLRHSAGNLQAALDRAVSRILPIDLLAGQRDVQFDDRVAQAGAAPAAGPQQEFSPLLGRERKVFHIPLAGLEPCGRAN
jgi:hypothetical protein